jgi:hypothetical protein
MFHINTKEVNSLWIESSWGMRFPHQSEPALRPAQPPLQWIPQVSSLGVKWLGNGTDHPSPPSTKIKEGVEVYLYFHSKTFMACFKANFLPYSNIQLNQNVLSSE